VRLALLASVTKRRPPVSRVTMYASTVPTLVRPAVTPSQACGSCSASQLSLVAVKYGSSRSPVSSATRSPWPASLRASHWAAVRRSCQTIARRGAASVRRSHSTAVSRWSVTPTQVTSSSPASAMRAAASVACQISSGSCSTQPGRGKCWANSW
jgi:hypothetical protein